MWVAINGWSYGVNVVGDMDLRVLAHLPTTSAFHRLQNMSRRFALAEPHSDKRDGYLSRRALPRPQSYQVFGKNDVSFSYALSQSLKR